MNRNIGYPNFMDNDDALDKYHERVSVKKFSKKCFYFYEVQNSTKVPDLDTKIAPK